MPARIVLLTPLTVGTQISYMAVDGCGKPRLRADLAPFSFVPFSFVEGGLDTLGWLIGHRLSFADLRLVRCP